MLKKYFPSFFIVAATLIFFSPAANALTFDQTALRILEEGPEFRAETLSMMSFDEALKVSDNLPDPQLEGEYLFAPADEPNRWGAELSWGLEWPGVYGTRKKENKAQISANTRAVELARNNRMTEIRKHLLDYILQQKKIELLQHMCNDNDSLYMLAEHAAKGGEMTLLDVNKVRLENAGLKATKASLLDERAVTMASLSSLYGADCAPLLSSMECEFPPLLLPSAQDIETAIMQSPRILAAEAETELTKKSRKTALMEAFPSLSVGYKHAFEDGTHFNGATLGISIPMFSSRNRQKAAKAAIAESEFKEETARQVTHTDITQALNRLRLMTEQIREIESILQITDHHSLLLKAYQGGVISLLDYLAERAYYTNASIDLLSLRHAAAVTITEIRGITGW